MTPPPTASANERSDTYFRSQRRPSNCLNSGVLVKISRLLISSTNFRILITYVRFQTQWGFCYNHVCFIFSVGAIRPANPTPNIAALIILWLLSLITVELLRLAARVCSVHATLTSRSYLEAMNLLRFRFPQVFFSPFLSNKAGWREGLEESRDKLISLPNNVPSLTTILYRGWRNEQRLAWP